MAGDDGLDLTDNGMGVDVDGPDSGRGTAGGAVGAVSVGHAGWLTRRMTEPMRPGTSGAGLCSSSQSPS